MHQSPAQQVTRTHGRQQDRCHLTQHVVAGRMIMTIIDGLKMIDIEGDHGGALAVAPGLCDGCRDAVEKAKAVQRPSQRICHAEPHQLRQRAVALSPGGDQQERPDWHDQIKEEQPQPTPQEHPLGRRRMFSIAS